MSEKRYIVKPQLERAEFQSRLDIIIEGDPGTTHYSLPILPVNPPNYPFDLWTLDERAEAVLTPEEWASTTVGWPTEFRPGGQP